MSPCPRGQRTPPRLLSSTVTSDDAMISTILTPSSTPLPPSPSLSSSRETEKRISMAMSAWLDWTRRAVVVSAFWCAE